VAHIVDTMLVVEIDVIDTEALERRVAGGAHVFGSAVDRAPAVGQDLVGELRPRLGNSAGISFLTFRTTGS